jgi:hypothetical protein
MITIILVTVYVLLTMPVMIYIIVDNKKRQQVVNNEIKEIKSKIGSLVREINTFNYKNHINK